MERFSREILIFSTLWFALAFPLLGQAQTDGLVDQAKREGKIVWYTTIAIPESRAIADVFERRHPYAKVDIFRSGAGGVVNRILAEFQARSYIVDVIQGISSRGAIPGFKQKGIIEKYIFPERKFVPDDLKDAEGYWTSIFQTPYVLVYNKNLVKSADIPKTYDDLLDPKWKGKKILNDTENFAWFGGLLRYWGREKALAYFKKLAEQDQVFQRGARGRVQLVIAGEFPLTIGYATHAQEYVDRGAPIDWVPLEPAVVNLNSVSLAKHAPHPATAKLFINFLFSKEAHLKLREFKRVPSRQDVDPDPPRLFRGFKRIPDDLENDDSEAISLYHQIFNLTR